MTPETAIVPTAIVRGSGSPKELIIRLQLLFAAKGRSHFGPLFSGPQCLLIEITSSSIERPI